MELDLDKLSFLVRIKLDEEEKTAMASSLSSIVNWTKNLQEVDVTNVEPLFQIVEDSELVREDNALLNNSCEDIFANSPERKVDYFAVPKVIE